MKTPKQVLVVDDRPEEVDTLLTYLRRQGWRVEYASSGEEALQKVKADPPRTCSSAIGICRE
ncbi:MAG: hypothetical protein KY468_13565 [Armatimonadetes bacterium]|nr:hypothetical protein [Armatimonadota bacterium]